MHPNENQFIEKLYQENYSKLRTYARLQLSDASVAEDMVQDAFHEAVNHIEIVMQHPAPEKWLRRTLANKIRNYERSRMRLLKHLIPMEDITQISSTESVENQVIEADAVPPLAQIERFLGPDDFYFLKRIAMEKASHMDMAQELGITVWASAKRLSRIRKRLSEKFPEFKKFL